MDFKTALTEVFIETTNHCNLNCVFCPYDQIERKKEIMPCENVIRLLDELEHDFDFGWISFHLYGEPLIHPDFLQIVEYATKIKKMKVNLTSNGILMSPEILEGFMQSGVWKIILSIQTPPDQFEARHSSTMNGEEYHRRIMESILSFVELKKKYSQAILELHYLDTSQFRPGIRLIEGDSEIRQIVEYWMKKVQQMSPGTQFNEEMRPFQDEGSGKLFEIMPGLRIRLKPAISFGNAIRSPDIPENKADEKCFSGHCDFAFNSIAILVNGDMVSCCLDHKGNNVFGNVFREGGIKKVYESRKARKFREQFIKKEIHSERCQECLGGVFLGSPI